MDKHIASKITAAATAVMMGGSAIPTVFAASQIKYEYGVFLSASGDSDLKKMEDYRIIVLDAQEESFTYEKIMDLKNKGHIVYSYINLGSIEDDRSYYKKYKNLTFAPYEDWPHERWVDVSSTDWQTFQSSLAYELVYEKGVDGFFVDNTDVYYVAKEESDLHERDIDPAKIFDGVTNILSAYKSFTTTRGESPYVLINGGDTYVTDYIEGVNGEDAEEYGFSIQGRNSLDGIIDGINQEGIFSTINFDYDDHNHFVATDKESSKYYKEYAELVDSVGKDVFLLEYTSKSSDIKNIKKYCEQNGFRYFATNKGDLKTSASTAGAMPVDESRLVNTPVEEQIVPEVPAASSSKQEAASSKVSSSKKESSSSKASKSSSKKESSSSKASKSSSKKESSSSKASKSSSSKKDSSSSKAGKSGSSKKKNPWWWWWF